LPNNLSRFPAGIKLRVRDNDNDAELAWHGDNLHQIA